MSSKERRRQFPPEVVNLDQYFNLFDTPLLNLRLQNPDHPNFKWDTGFSRRLYAEVGSPTAYLFSFSASSIWENKNTLAEQYPAFTPYRPRSGFMINGDENLKVKWSNMLGDAVRWSESEKNLEVNPDLYMSLCFHSLLLGVTSASTFANLSEEDLNLLKRLRFRVEFPTVPEKDGRDEVPGSSYDASAEIVAISEDEEHESGFKRVVFKGYSPSEMPFSVTEPFLKDGIPIRLGDPTFTNDPDWILGIRGKFFLAREGLLPEYEAATRVTQPREFKPGQ